ncbi:piggyBac transposable element-derived protein 4-like [Vespula maculifrons]|uniref:PiggyBac transposable element-derived protein 4-like n=1 Tax=Vespula maculifrons TaxID=7453 RepID=A0ABD2BHK9_VESMC
MGGVDKGKQHKNKITHLQFVCRLVDQLVEDFRESGNTSSFAGTKERLKDFLHVIRQDDTGRSKDCVLCSTRKIKDRRRK